ncbi:hypothetical protein H4S07_006349, partial [Coemansia furcata]
VSSNVVISDEQAYERTIPSVTIKDLAHWGQYAGAAYDNFEEWDTCGKCQITETLRHTSLNTTWSTALPAFSRGYIGVNHRLRQVIVAFRGTTHIMDVLADAQVTQTQWPAHISGSGVHFGFLLAYLSARQTVQAAVQALMADLAGYSVTFVGHSLGGAQAVLGFVDYCQRAECGGNAGLVTFGAPRVGNQPFAQHVNSLLPSDRLWRVVHASDMVAHLPQSLLGRYVHSDREVWVNDGNITVCEPSPEDHADGGPHGLPGD